MFWGKGEKALSWQSHGVALTAFELGNGALYAPFPDRARALPREKSRRKKRSGCRKAIARICALRRRSYSLSHATAVNCGWHDSVSRGRNRAAPLPTHLLRICAGTLKRHGQCAVSKLANGQRHTVALPRKRLLTPKPTPKKYFVFFWGPRGRRLKCGILPNQKCVCHHRKRVRRKDGAESTTPPACLWQATVSRGRNRAAPLPTHLLRICAGTLKRRAQCAVSKLANGQSHTVALTRKRLLTPKRRLQ